MKGKTKSKQIEGGYSFEEFERDLKKLSPFDQRVVLWRVSWIIFKWRLSLLPAKWVKFQLDLQSDMKEMGMPRQIHWQLVKRFNRQPFPDVADFFICKGRKIWHTYLLKKYNFEFHLYYKSECPGLIWLKLKRDGTAVIWNMRVGEKFRNTGLGAFAFQESVKLLTGRVTCIKGVLKKKYHPEPTASLRWLRKQGFEISQKKNGDYEFQFWIDKDQTKETPPLTLEQMF